MSRPIVVALDFPSAAQAIALAERLNPQQCRLKVGKELFTRSGPQVVERLQALGGLKCFLILSFTTSLTPLQWQLKQRLKWGVWMVNVHCSGGLKMMQACRDVLDQHAGVKPLLIGVTVLTSMEQADLAGIGLDVTPEQHVLRLAGLAEQAGLDGLVCSAQEARILKQQWPAGQLVTPRYSSCRQCRG